MFCVIVSFLFLLLRVAFYTLFERKLLSFSQGRLGPNKVGLLGLPQPILDGVKLLSKEFLFPQFSGITIFLLSPVLFFIFRVVLWFSFRGYYFLYSREYGLFFVLAVFSIKVYTRLLAGVSSFSKFGVVGSMRSVSQRVSYEVVLSFYVLGLSFLFDTLSLSHLPLSFGFITFPFWFVLVLIESNRAPFDFSEGERELIRGYNIEYGRGGFVFLFLGEYGVILFLSFWGSFLCGVNVFFGGRMCRLFVILIRRVLPRFRYDFLIGFCWLTLFPLSIVMIFLFFLLK